MIMLGSYVWLDQKTCSCVLASVLPDFSMITMITKEGNLYRKTFSVQDSNHHPRNNSNMYRLALLGSPSIYVHDIKSVTLSGGEHQCGIKNKLSEQIHTIPCSFPASLLLPEKYLGK